MIRWPNWVDLVVVIFVFRACYVGAARGVVAELLTLIAAVGVTAITINYAGPLTSLLMSQLPRLPGITPHLLTLGVFWGLFVSLLFCGRALVKWLAGALKGERVHWFTQSVGLFLGSVRGLWWAGWLLLVLTSSGIAYLHQSVEARSVLGPRLRSLSSAVMERVVGQLPGTQDPGASRIPPVIQPSK